MLGYCFDVWDKGKYVIYSVWSLKSHDFESNEAIDDENPFRETDHHLVFARRAFGRWKR